MKIVCPSCEAQYEVPEVVLTSRRKMRCARCETQWVPADIQASAPAVTEPAALPSAVPPDAAFHPASVPVGLNGAPDRAFDIEPSVGAPVALSAAPHDAAQDFILVDTDLDVQAAFATPASDATLEAPPRPVALRPDTPVTVLPGLSSLSRNDLPRTPLPVPAVDRGTPILAWVSSIAVVVVALAAIVIFRAPVMKAWPPSARLYAALGLAER